MKKTNTILDKIIASKQQELIELKKETSLVKLKLLTSERKTEIRNFKNALGRKDKLNIMAEIKKASPSEGLIRPNFNHVAIAQEYEDSGIVDAISVLTESNYFQGKLSYLADIKAETSIPVFRKDFIFDEYQIYESYLAEADALLLIVAALEKEQLRYLIQLTHSLGMECLVETHDEKEIIIALEAQATIIGINARNLKTFHLDNSLFGKYSHLIPNTKIKVAESGLESAEDLKKVYTLGANAVLIGASLMRSDSIQKKLSELTAF
jgi:indole-3-glycerol phosphate synthase